MALRYSAFCVSVRRGPNSFRRAERNSAPSPWRLAFEYCAIRRNRICGSCGGPTLLMALKYSSSGRGEPETEVFLETDPADVSRKPRSKIPDNTRATDK